MLFPTHLVAAWLLATRWNRSPTWTVAGAALPDVVDKPVAMAGFYDLYHSVGHSALVLLVAGLLGLGLVAVVPGRGHGGRTAGLALWIGWASHLALDAVAMPLNGRPDDVLFLAWPVVEHTPAVRLPPVEFALHYLGTPAFALEGLIWVAFVAVVVGRFRSGTPTP